MTDLQRMLKSARVNLEDFDDLKELIEGTFRGYDEIISNYQKNSADLKKQMRRVSLIGMGYGIALEYEQNRELSPENADNILNEVAKKIEDAVPEIIPENPGEFWGILRNLRNIVINYIDRWHDYNKIFGEQKQEGEK